MHRITFQSNARYRGVTLDGEDRSGRIEGEGKGDHWASHDRALARARESTGTAWLDGPGGGMDRACLSPQRRFYPSAIPLLLSRDLACRRAQDADPIRLKWKSRWTRQGERIEQAEPRAVTCHRPAIKEVRMHYELVLFEACWGGNSAATEFETVTACVGVLARHNRALDGYCRARSRNASRLSPRANPGDV